MAKGQTPPQIAEAIALLPANGGEMEYQAWKDAMYANGLPQAAALGIHMKKHGVKFRGEVTPTSKKMFVSRGSV